MVYFPKAKAKSKRRPYRKRFSKAKAKSKTSAVYQAVKKVMGRQIETKMNDTEMVTGTIQGFIDNTKVFPLLPLLTQGTGEGNRIGNRVNCCNLTMRLNIYVNNQSTVVPPIWIDFYIYKVKPLVTLPPSAGIMSQFLEDGNSSTQYVGTVLDGLRKLNDEYFTSIIHKRFLLFNPLNTSNYLSSSSQAGPCKTMVLNLTKYVKKVWMFNDLLTQVTNDNLYMSIGATVCDGSVLALATAFGTISYVVEASYKDA